MSIITLSTDFGHKDYFVAVLKEKIFNAFSEAKILDITHKIDLYNLSDTAYNLLGVLQHFTLPAFHFVFVDSEIESSNEFILAKKNNQWIFVANNGLISLLSVYHSFDEIYKIEKPTAKQSTVDCYLSFVEHINNGQLPEQTPIEEIKQLTELKVSYNKENNQLRGVVIYEDNYGNLVTNITKELFDKYRENRKFTCKFSNYSFDRIQSHYEDFRLKENETVKQKEGSGLLLFNDQNFLQISIYKSKENGGGIPRNLMNLSYRDTVFIEFEE